MTRLLRLLTRFALVVVMAATVLGGCAGLLGPRNVEVPLSTLQASLERRFPFNNRYLELFDIQLRTPRLSLEPGTSRVVTTFDAAIAPAWLKRSWQGSFALSGMLGLDPARNAVILVDPRVDTFNLNGVDPAYSRQVAKIAGLLAEQVFRDMPLYTFQPDDFRYGGTTFLPTKINTGTNGLVVTFEPAR